MEALYQTVRMIAVYLLFVSVLLGILQDSPFKTYVHLFAGLLLVLLLVHAVVPFFFADFDMETLMDQIVHTDDFTERLEEAQKAGEDQIRNQILEEFTEKVKSLSKGFGYTVQKIEIELGEDYQMEMMELVLEEEVENPMVLEEVQAVFADYFLVDFENITIRISNE